MLLYRVRVEETLERYVTVEADTVAQARGMAERGPNAWLDTEPPESRHVEALRDVQRLDPDGTPDAMQAWRDQEEKDAS